MALVAGTELDRYVSANNPEYAIVETFLTAAGDFTEWFRFVGPVSFQVTGDATNTAASVQPEVSAHDPSTMPGAEISPGSAVISGSLVSGLPPLYIYEAGAIWWRARLVSVTGNPVSITMRGQHA